MCPVQHNNGMLLMLNICNVCHLCCYIISEGITGKQHVIPCLQLPGNSHLMHAAVLLACCSATEMLDRDDKFFCDTCGCLQEAQKRMKIKQLPACLIFHLKRFKYIEQLNRYEAPELQAPIAHATLGCISKCQCSSTTWLSPHSLAIMYL